MNSSSEKKYNVDQLHLDNENNITKKEVLNILWTGGWDSTYRLIMLSDKNITIQPFYVKDNRYSEEYELHAIKNIKEEILTKPSTRFSINDLHIIHSKDIEKDSEITSSFDRLLKKQYMGSQYDWLARLAKNVNGLELCIHSDDQAYKVINAFGKFKKMYDEELGAYYILDNDASEADLCNVFGNFRFPLIDENKINMMQKASQLNFDYVLDLTWFCYNPINNAPCGMCNPCQYAIEEGMSFRFTQKALKRYKYGKAKNKFKSFCKKIGVLK
jgi:7-cyano-7-deazaguanine synthase